DVSTGGSPRPPSEPPLRPPDPRRHFVKDPLLRPPDPPDPSDISGLVVNSGLVVVFFIVMALTAMSSKSLTTNLCLFALLKVPVHFGGPLQCLEVARSWFLAAFVEEAMARIKAMAYGLIACLKPLFA